MVAERQVEARITHDPEILRGKAIIRGTRIPVYLIVDFVANGATPAEIVDDYPDLAIEDVEAAVAFAAEEHARVDLRRR